MGYAESGWWGKVLSNQLSTECGKVVAKVI
jgi:hypothetical protein